MPRSNIRKSDVEQQIVDIISTLINSFRSKRKIEYRDIHLLFFTGTDYPELREERRMVWQVIDILTKSNPQISPRLIFSKFIDEIVGIVIFNPSIKNDALVEKTRKKVKKLINYSSSRDIDIPIVCLDVDGSPFTIGKVTFHSVNEEDLIGDWWEKVRLNYSGNSDTEILSYGRIQCPGDWEIALDYAQDAIRESLLVLRGIGFPFIIEEVNQFGFINEFPVWPNIPLRLHKPKETVRIEGASDVVTRLGPPIMIWRLYSDILKDVEDNEIININQLLSADSESNLTNMQSKYLSGLHWLGEATKPDTLSSRYLKLSTALEHLIGGESSQEYLSTRGITATLAERAAFILGQDKGNRLSIDRDVKKYYRLRSKIVHGQNAVISGNEFIEFGCMVRQIALTLCQRINEFKDIDDLQKWIIRMRYS